MNSLPPNEQPTIGPGANLRIEVHAGPLAGKGFPFEGNALTFGRAENNDITLDDSRVSRYHAVLRRQGDQLILEDLGSTNGTLVNGKRIYNPHVLQPTETITIGASVFGVTGFAAPATVGMSAQSDNRDDIRWQTYQSSSTYAQPGVQGSGNWLLWTGLILLIGLIIAIIGASVFAFRNNGGNGVAASVPSVLISSPVNGSEFQVGQRVIVQATATDVEGVVRMELWVGGQKIGQAVSPSPKGQSPFTAVMEWTPQVEGSYSLAVRAFNARGGESAPTTINLNVGGSVLSPTPTPAPTATATPVPSGVPVGVVRTDLNVRSGPGTQYQVVGRVAANTEVEIVGRNDDESWWYIVYPNTPDQRGWVAAEYAPSQNAGGVPVVDTPTPIPTNTPTATATPVLTETPTSTPTKVPTATNTPVPPTATPTGPPQASITFSAKPLAIDAGQCTVFSWLITNVQAVYFQDEGVAGDDNGLPVTKEECPQKTTTYTLRIIKLDDQQETREITITVNAKPDAPSNLAIAERLQDGFKFTWTDNSDIEDGFKLYNADNNETLKTFAADATAGTTTGLACDTAYRLYLVAFNDIGESPPSNIVVDQTLSCP